MSDSSQIDGTSEEGAAERARVEEETRIGEYVLYGKEGNVWTGLAGEAMLAAGLQFRAATIDGLIVHPYTPSDTRIRAIPTLCLALWGGLGDLKAWKCYCGIEAIISFLRLEHGLNAHLVSSKLVVQ